MFPRGSGGAELQRVPQEESSGVLGTILSAEKRGETARASTSRSSHVAGTSAKPGPASGRCWHPRSGPGAAGTAAASCCGRPASRSPRAASSSASSFLVAQRGGRFYSLGFCLPVGFSSPLAEGGLGMLQAARCRWLGGARGGSHGAPGSKGLAKGREPQTHALRSPARCQHQPIAGTAAAGHGPSACGCPSAKTSVMGTRGWLGSSLPRAEQGRGEQRSGVFPKGQG